MYTLSNLNFMGKSPKIDPDAFVAPRVFLAGDVRISRYASLWPGVVARGDVNYISIGECSNVQDLVCLHVADDFPCIIGDYVTIGHCACVHACTIEDHVLIGMNATVLTGAKVGKGSIIAAGARTGRYLLAGEEFTTNAEGKSYISYADYAIAMVDEAEKGNHKNQRISVLGK